MNNEMDWTFGARRAGDSVALSLRGKRGLALTHLAVALDDEAARALIAELETSLLPDGSPCKNCRHTVKRCPDGGWDDCSGWVHEGETGDSIGRLCEGLHGCPPDARRWPGWTDSPTSTAACGTRWWRPP